MRTSRIPWLVAAAAALILGNTACATVGESARAPNDGPTGVASPRGWGPWFVDQNGDGVCDRAADWSAQDDMRWRQRDGWGRGGGWGRGRGWGNGRGWGRGRGWGYGRGWGRGDGWGYGRGWRRGGGWGWGAACVDRDGDGLCDPLPAAPAAPGETSE